MIVINTEPSNTVALNNEIIFTVFEATKTADAVTYPNYKYVCDVYVNSVLVGRMKATPDPTYKRGIFNVANILRSYVTYGLDASTTLVDYTVKLNYQVKFGEEYDDTLYTNILVDSSDRSAFKTYKKRPFENTTVLSNGLASNMPSEVNQHRDVYQLIPYFSNVTGIADITRTYKDEAGATVATQTIPNATYAADTIRQVNVGTLAATNDTASYSLLTGPFSLRINHLCPGKYDPYTIVWLNPFGGYESQTFGLKSKKTLEIARKNFSQLNYRMNASGVISYSANNVYYGSKRGYATSSKVKLKMCSHLLTEDEYTWLADLFESPDVYLYDSVLAKFIPVTISATSYEYRNYSNSRLTALDFEVEFSDELNAQYL